VAICDHLKVTFDVDITIQRWGKFKIPGDITLRSRISEEAGRASRSSRYFESQKEGLIFGEALAFYSLPDPECSVVVYNSLVKRVKVFERWCGEWSEDCAVLNTSSLTKLVGVHMLRKHAGVDMLDGEEYYIEEEEE
jgi:hypothetical protein